MPKRKKSIGDVLTSWEPIWLRKIHIPNWIVFILALTFLFRIPSFFEPYYYGDEMIYLNLGEAIRRGLVLYRDIHDNKPPLLYFMAAVAGNVFWFRAILAGWMMATTVLFWKLSEVLFPKNNLVVKVSVSAFAILTTIPLLEGQISNAELFMIGPTIWAFLIILTKKLTAKNLLFAGFLLAVSTLFKVPSAFDIGAIIFLWIITTKFEKKSFIDFIKHSIVLMVGFSVPILVTFVWYAARGALSEYFVAAFLQNIGYLSSFRPDDVVEPFLVKNGPLIVRGLILVISLGILYLLRKKLSKPFIIATAWLLFSLFAATLSERPYPHYLIQVVPAASLLIGMLAAVQSIEQSLSIVPLFLVLLAALRFQFWYYPSLPYYKNFVSFIGGESTKEKYFSNFDKNTSRNYKIAAYLRSSVKESDPVFVWGDSPSIYAASRRLPPIKYVATYHITDFSSQEEVITKLRQKPPKIVVVLPNSPSFPLLDNYLVNDYLEIEEIEGAKIWKYLNFSTDSLQN